MKNLEREAADLRFSIANAGNVLGWKGKQFSGVASGTRTTREVAPEYERNPTDATWTGIVADFTAAEVEVPTAGKNVTLDGVKMSVASVHIRANGVAVRLSLERIA